MSSGEQIPYAGDLNELKVDQVMSAEIRSRLREADGKTLDVVDGGNGLYVRRTFSGEALDDITHGGFRAFFDVWHDYNEMLGGADITMVESSLVEGAPQDHPTIVSRYLRFAQRNNTVKNLSIEEKTKLMGKLGILLTSSLYVLPDSQGIAEDAFAVEPETGEPILIDVDPYVKYRNPTNVRAINAMRHNDAICAFFWKMGINIESWASDDRELVEMAHAFVLSSGSALDDDTPMEVLELFGDLHLLSKGLHKTRGDLLIANSSVE